MSAPPGVARQSDLMVRPADKGADTGIDAALVRIATDRIAAATGARRKDARSWVHRWVGVATTRAELDAWLRATFRIDPTGVIAVRNVTRERGY